VYELAGQGRIRVDASGAVIGSAGLSIQPDRHEIDLDGQRFWTWCAYDILRIFGALRATGHSRSVVPDDGSPVEIRFHNGRPEPATVVSFLPDDEDLDACCTSMYDQWCPNSNLFRAPAAATAWSTAHHITGKILSLPDAADLSTRQWQLLTQPTRTS
jgi:hypothetical protein